MNLIRGRAGGDSGRIRWNVEGRQNGWSPGDVKTCGSELGSDKGPFWGLLKRTRRVPTRRQLLRVPAQPAFIISARNSDGAINLYRRKVTSLNPPPNRGDGNVEIMGDGARRNVGLKR